MKLTAIPRITMGLVSLSVGLLLVFDLVLHLFPSEEETMHIVRSRLSNSLAIQAAALLQARDKRSIDLTLSAIQSRDADIVSIGLRQADGTLVSQSGDHAGQWSNSNDGAGSANEISVGILSNQQRWGALEITFRPIFQRNLIDWIFSGPSKLLLLFSISAGAIYFIYLRRMLQHLDPTAAVPDRVRGAFDALTEGVMIVNPTEQILLVNQAFVALAPESVRATLIGQRASSLSWLALRPDETGGDDTPWVTCMSRRQPTNRQYFQVTREDSAALMVVVRCTPLLDENRAMRGCLVTIDDVTALEQSYEDLREVLADLAISREQLEIRNQALEQLANHDPLSGCLNRRSFFDSMERLFKRGAQGEGELSCIMADIDHFKLINDRHGHAVGDEAIKCFSAILRSSVRQGDLVCRYGGEEFCVVAAVSMERAVKLAETLRQRLAADRSVANGAGGHVEMSASFGVTTMRLGARTEAEFVDQADRAMYIAKKTGRNQVILFNAPADQTNDAIEGSTT